MLIHLESGTCASEVTEEEIDDIAHEYPQNKQYIDDTLENGGWIYVCPICDKDFLNFQRFTSMLKMLLPVRHRPWEMVV